MRGRRRSLDSLQPQLRRRRRYHRFAYGALILLALSAVLDRAGLFRYAGSDWRAYDHQSFLVTHVIDGDTLEVRPASGGATTRVRLLGVDAPELRSREKGDRPDHWAAQARDYTERRAEGKRVTLRLEATETRDRYRRLLAYVYVADAQQLNLDLVRDGHAYADRRFTHSMRPQFEQAEAEARRKGRGLWEAVTESQMPHWRRQWLAARRTR